MPNMKSLILTVKKIWADVKVFDKQRDNSLVARP